MSMDNLNSEVSGKGLMEQEHTGAAEMEYEITENIVDDYLFVSSTHPGGTTTYRSPGKESSSSSSIEIIDENELEIDASQQLDLKKNEANLQLNKPLAVHRSETEQEMTFSFSENEPGSEHNGSPFVTDENETQSQQLDSAKIKETPPLKKSKRSLQLNKSFAGSESGDDITLLTFLEDDSRYGYNGFSFLPDKNLTLPRELSQQLDSVRNKENLQLKYSETLKNEIENEKTDSFTKNESSPQHSGSSFVTDENETQMEISQQLDSAKIEETPLFKKSKRPRFRKGFPSSTAGGGTLIFVEEESESEDDEFPDKNLTLFKEACERLTNSFTNNESNPQHSGSSFVTDENETQKEISQQLDSLKIEEGLLKHFETLKNEETNNFTKNEPRPQHSGSSFETQNEISQQLDSIKSEACMQVNEPLFEKHKNETEIKDFNNKKQEIDIPIHVQRPFISGYVTGAKRNITYPLEGIRFQELRNYKRSMQAHGIPSVRNEYDLQSRIIHQYPEWSVENSASSQPDEFSFIEEMKQMQKKARTCLGNSIVDYSREDVLDNASSVEKSTSSQPDGFIREMFAQKKTKPHLENYIVNHSTEDALDIVSSDRLTEYQLQYSPQFKEQAQRKTTDHHAELQCNGPSSIFEGNIKKDTVNQLAGNLVKNEISLTYNESLLDKAKSDIQELKRSLRDVQFEIKLTNALEKVARLRQSTSDQKKEKVKKMDDKKKAKQWINFEYSNDEIGIVESIMMTILLSLIAISGIYMIVYVHVHFAVQSEMEEVMGGVKQENKLFRERILKDVMRENWKLKTAMHSIIKRLERQEDAQKVLEKARNIEYLYSSEKVNPVNGQSDLEVGKKLEEVSNSSVVKENTTKKHEEIDAGRISKEEITLLKKHLEQFNDVIDEFSSGLDLLAQDATPEENPCSFWEEMKVTSSKRDKSKSDKTTLASFSDLMKGTKNLSDIFSDHVEAIKNAGYKSYEFTTKSLSCLAYKFDEGLGNILKDVSPVYREKIKDAIREINKVYFEKSKI